MALLDDIATHLTNQGVVGGATGWEIKKSFLGPTPDKQIVLYETGGVQGDADEGTQYDYPTFQVHGRGAVFEYDLLRVKMQEVYEALHDRSVSGFVYVYGSQSAPLPAGYDDNDRPQLTWNFTTMRER